jgi:hypothetical protein
MPPMNWVLKTVKPLPKSLNMSIGKPNQVFQAVIIGDL